MNCSDVERFSVPMGVEICNVLKLEKSEPLSCPEQVYIKHFELHCQGLTILIDDAEDELPKFGQISCTFVKEQKCCLVLKLVTTLR